MKPTPITIAGETFRTLKDAAAKFQISPQTLARRLGDGWSPEQALGLQPRARAARAEEFSTNLVTSVGTFKTIDSAAQQFGLSASMVARRLRRGWSADEAVGLAPHATPRRVTTTIDCAGSTFPSIAALAEAFNVLGRLVFKRLKAGWTPEQAVNLEGPPPRFRDQTGGARSRHWKRVEIVADKAYPGAPAGEFKVYLIRNEINGKEYVGITVTPLSDRLRGHRANARKGVKGKLYNSMRQHGAENFTIGLLRSDANSFAELQEQEIEEIQKRGTLGSGYNTSPGGSIGTPDEVDVAGVTYPSRGAAAAHFGIETSVFNLRISRLGWTPEQAAEIESRGRFARRRVVVADQAFPSLKAAAEHFGLDYKVIFRRVTASDWTIEQALNLAPAPIRTARGKLVSVAGVSYSSVKDACRQLGKDAGKVHMRLQLGWTPDEAFDVVNRGDLRGLRSGTPFVVAGVEYPSQAMAARAHGLPPKVVHNRMTRSGWSIEQAFGILPPPSRTRRGD